MLIFNNIQQMRTWSLQNRCENKSIAFVPTMGSLHDGHLSLVSKAKEMAEKTVVSIFLNQYQFNDAKDFQNYPTSDQTDIELLKDKNVDVLFMPKSSEVYPNGDPTIVIDYPELTNQLCGLSRDGHFNSVLTIVHNLLMWVNPDIAIFGQKDYQQWLLIYNMCSDLNLPVKIIRSEIHRQNDGLALSSRNARLSDNGKIEALTISQTLNIVHQEWSQNRDITSSDLQIILQTALKNLDVEYCGIYDMQTLQPLKESIKVDNAIVAVAVYIEKVRCIDNVLLTTLD